MSAAEMSRTTGEMMRDILGNVGSQVRNETDLARAEFAESMGKAMASLGTMAVAVVLGVVGLNILAPLLVGLLIMAGLDPVWAATAVGAGLILVATILFFSAKAAFNQIGFMPTRTARNLERDAAAFREPFHDK